jgi:hypothetical protein
MDWYRKTNKQRIGLDNQAQKQERENRSTQKRGAEDEYSSHAELTVENANAGTVAQSIHQYLKDNPSPLKGKKLFFNLKDYSFVRILKNEIADYRFIILGEKSISRVATLGTQKNTAQAVISEMLTIFIKQTSNNTVKVSFDSDDTDAFVPVAYEILNELKGSYSISEVIGLPKEPEIIISPSNEDGELDYKHGEICKVTRLRVFNNMEKETIRCYATLQRADDIIDYQNNSAIPLIPSLGSKHKPERIEWNSRYMNEQYEIEIPSKDSREIELADTHRTLHYNLRYGNVEVNMPSKIHTFKIRVDYFTKTEQKFSSFEGYMYFANHMPLDETEIKKFGSDKLKTQADRDKDRIQYLKMKIKDGDWRRDEEVKSYLAESS